MTNISIIGAGRLGTSLGYALSKKGYRIKALSCRTLSSAKESRQIIGEGIASIDNVQTARVGELVFLCLPDEEIAKVTRSLLALTLIGQRNLFFIALVSSPLKSLNP